MASSDKQSKPTKEKKSSKKSETSTKRKAPPPVPVKSTQRIQESDLESDVESKDGSSEDDLVADTSSKKTNGTLPAPSGSESSSEGDSGSEESEDEEESAEEPTTEIEPQKKPSKATAPISQNRRAPQSFVPPCGFQPGKLQDGASSQLFKKSNLAGKQIWYFTAPASVPVSSIEQMSIQDAKKGNAIFSHVGVDYGFVQDTLADTSHTRILVPNSSDDGYRASSKEIDQVLHLQQIVRLPGVTSAGVSERATVPAAKPIRPQPKGLKIRFQAIGTGGGDAGGHSDEESEEEQFQAPPTIDSDIEMTEAPIVLTKLKSGKKDKKDKKERKEKRDENENKENKEMNASLKRKHGEEKESKSKHSSYTLNDVDERQLKRSKTNETNPHKVSASIKSSQQSPPRPTSSGSSKSKLSKPTSEPSREARLGSQSEFPHDSQTVKPKKKKHQSTSSRETSTAELKEQLTGDMGTSAGDVVPKSRRKAERADVYDLF